MTRDAAGRALVTIGLGGYRTPPISGDLVDFWTNELEAQEDADLDKASHDWATEMDHYPTLAEFIDAVRFARRRRMAKEGKTLETQDRNDDRSPELPREENLRRLRALRDEMATLTGPLFTGAGADAVPNPEGATE